MLEKFLKIETLSVVLIGDFNPVIFQPAWLANKSLIRESEAEKAEIEVIHNELNRFSLEWVEIEIAKNRCEFRSSKVAHFPLVRDLIVGIFSILQETPIKSFGMNHLYDLSLGTVQRYHAFGEALTPLNLWATTLSKARLLDLQILEEDVSNAKNGRKRIQITPTPNSTIGFGVLISINNHFELNKPAHSANEHIALLKENWETSFLDARHIINEMLNKISF
ncbi:MAG: hypothetical protein KA239_06460 [Bacteroidia bacterium]|nr:hypothetical protein [Bacteroidia bacterium]